jgi:hypothetical protein
MIFTDELLADARRRYEQTAEAKSAIGADLGIAPSTFDKLATRLRWTRFTPPARGLDAAAKLAATAQAFTKAIAASECVTAAAARDDDDAAPEAAPLSSTVAPPPIGPQPGAAGGYDDMAMDSAALIAWLRREIQAQIGIVKQLREQERAEPLTDEAAIRLARILSSLADALTKLDRHTAGAPHAVAEPDDLPENIDEFRIDLARRIEAFVASRRHAGDGEGDAAAAVAETGS